MATTTNFGWETPDDTDLVKDGAAAIRTALGGVDTSFVDLKGGTTGQILTKASGTDLDFTWAAPGGGGKVLQVVAGYSNTATSNSTNSFADTTLTASITPSSTASKVLVLVSQNGVSRSTTNQYQGVNLRLLANGTNISNFAYELTATYTNLFMVGAASASYLHSPASTSAVTYKTQFACAQNETNTTVQFASSNSSIILMEIGA